MTHHKRIFQNWQMLYEWEVSERCDEQPDDVDEIVAGGVVTNKDTANRR